MADIQIRLGTDVLVVQGPMGTELMRMGFEAGLPLDLLNLAEPEEVLELHRRYCAAGADCGLTNTFMATPARLAGYGLDSSAEQINRAGAQLAIEAGFTHVLGCIGPCGIEVRGNSDDDAGYVAARDQYCEQAGWLASAGVEGVMLQTFASTGDVLAAVAGVRRACDLPVLACMTFLSGDSGEIGAAEAASLLEQAGAAAVGCNCMPVAQTVSAVAQMRASCGLPLIALPNAGVPCGDGVGVYPSGPDDFARASLDLLRAGARIVGSCCGSTPACTGAIFATVGGVQFPE